MNPLRGNAKPSSDRDEWRHVSLPPGGPGGRTRPVAAPLGAAGLASLVLAVAVALVFASTRLAVPGSDALARTQQTTSAATGVAQKASPADLAPIKMTTAQLREWRVLTNTPRKRAQVIQAFAESFAGVAEVTTVDPASSAPTASTSSFVVTAGYHAQPSLAYGYNGHFWVTASYADMAAGVIWAAVRYCSTRLPAWLCNYTGNVLTSWARGWGSASNHGVWAAAYWSGTFTGGRW